MVLTKQRFGQKPLTKQRAIAELIFAGSLWGFGFVAATWALQSFTAAETLLYRYLIAFTLGEVIRFVLQPKTQWRIPRQELNYAMGAGVFLGGMLLFQTIGLKYTTATKSGFITSLYVVLVPLIQTAWLRGRGLDYRVWINVAIAFAGMLLLLGDPRQDWNEGDLWTLLCAVIAALHIIYIGYAAKKEINAFRFNNYQSLFSIFTLLPLLVSQNQMTAQASSLSIVGVFILGLAVSVLAFTIQVRTQKVLSNTTASMLFLLESPFAFFFGWLLLNERLNTLQFSGAGLIMIASILTILWERTSLTTQKKEQ